MGRCAQPTWRSHILANGDLRSRAISPATLFQRPSLPSGPGTSESWFFERLVDQSIQRPNRLQQGTTESGWRGTHCAMPDGVEVRWLYVDLKNKIIPHYKPLAEYASSSHAFKQIATAFFLAIVKILRLVSPPLDCNCRHQRYKRSCTQVL